MLLNFTEVGTDNLISINPSQVIAVFTSADEESKGNTVLLMIGGHFVVNEDILEAIGRINGELK
jgi:hypothetical protein